MKTNHNNPIRSPRVRDVNREPVPPLDGDKPGVTVTTPPPASDDGGEGVLSGQHRDLAGNRPGTPKQGRPSHAE